MPGLWHENGHNFQEETDFIYPTLYTYLLSDWTSINPKMLRSLRPVQWKIVEMKTLLLVFNWFRYCRDLTHYMNIMIFNCITPFFLYLLP